MVQPFRGHLGDTTYPLDFRASCSDVGASGQGVADSAVAPWREMASQEFGLQTSFEDRKMP